MLRSMGLHVPRGPRRLAADVDAEQAGHPGDGAGEGRGPAVRLLGALLGLEPRADEVPAEPAEGLGRNGEDGRVDDRERRELVLDAGAQPAEDPSREMRRSDAVAGEAEDRPGAAAWQRGD